MSRDVAENIPANERGGHVPGPSLSEDVRPPASRPEDGLVGRTSGATPTLSPIDAPVATRSARQPSIGSRSPWLSTLRTLARDPTALLGAALLLIVVLAAAGAPIVAPHDPLQVHVRDRLQLPSTTYLLGTDELGRDLLSRLIYAARVSLAVGVVAVLIAAVGGVSLGLIAGFFGGNVDAVTMR